MTQSHPLHSYRQRNFMAYIGRNDCTGNVQFLHFDGEYSRIVDFADDDAACAYRDALATETVFLSLTVN
jgi:hypothetical protein